jgi:hypothetical protein
MKMTRTIAIVAGGTLAASAALYVSNRSGDKRERTPPEAVREMAFPVGLVDVVPDAIDGTVCHEVYKRHQDPKQPDILIKSHRMKKDWRGSSDEQRREWVIEDTLEIIDESGLACASPAEDWFFRSAYAQPSEPPICEECGGGCSSWSCPGAIVFSHCYVGGGGCVVSFICCGHNCRPGSC